MANLGAWIAGGNPTNGRVKDDFYPTPPGVAKALLRYYEDAPAPGIPKRVWEPACGDGAISKVLIESGFDVTSSDLVYRGYGQRAEFDFLKTCPGFHEDTAIITNPPFSLAAGFTETAHKTGSPFIAFLLKSSYWHAKSRAPLFEKYPPTDIFALTWRPDFLERGAPTMEAMWCVWDHRLNRSGTTYHLLAGSDVG